MPHTGLPPILGIATRRCPLKAGKSGYRYIPKFNMERQGVVSCIPHVIGFNDDLHHLGSIPVIDSYAVLVPALSAAM